MQSPSQDFDEVFFAICKNVNTPFSLSRWLRWKYRDYTSAPPIDPSRYDAAYPFSLDYLVSAWASKAQVNLEGINLKEKALLSFIADEEFNASTNRKFREWSLRGGTPRAEYLIHGIRRKIASILGPLNVSRMLNRCRFGNGATATLSRVRARVDLKLTTLPFSVSPAALGYARLVIESDPHWGSAICRAPVEGPFSLLPQCFEVIDYNKFDTVPKSLSGDRTIAKEPVLNGFLQQGVHSYLRERLAKTGINLRDQSVNQNWASLAQELDLATIDAEHASNSVTKGLVELLLPPDWFEFLNSLRSRKTLLPDGTVHRNEMFSSMGNAFTFELESLLFYSILYVTCKGNRLVSVYGDDMVVPQEYGEDCVCSLSLFGFRVNRSKTFLSGRFFESCGKHYFDGTEVTPVYQKASPRKNLSERIHAHNRLIRWALRTGSGLCLDSTVRSPCALLARDQRPSLFGPIGPEGDGYFQVPYGNFRVVSGRALVTSWKAVTKFSAARQAGSYAYWLRLRNEADNCVLEAQQRTGGVPGPSDPLVLSEFSEERGFGFRKERIPVEEIRVDVEWLTNKSI